MIDKSIILRESIVKITENTMNALILTAFIDRAQRFETKSVNGESVSDWFQFSSEEIKIFSLTGLSPSNLLNHVKSLIAKKFIEKGNFKKEHQFHTIKNTVVYRVNFTKINSEIQKKEFGYGIKATRS